jgi:uncharacterized membrane protein
MSDRLLSGLTIVSMLGCGLVGGVFFAFSTFVMQALARLPTPQGVAAMQSINIVVINPLFMGALFGSALMCIALGIASIVRWGDARAFWMLVGGLSYLVGSILVTIAFNVPLNNALAAVDPGGADAAALWPRYVAVWMAWNHVRAVAAIAAAASFAVSLIRTGP